MPRSQDLSPNNAESSEKQRPGQKKKRFFQIFEVHHACRGVFVKPFAMERDENVWQLFTRPSCRTDMPTTGQCRCQGRS